MSRDDLLKVNGVVVEALSGGQFSVRLDDDRIISAKISGRLRKFHINVLVGDKVVLGISPYDLSHGLILSREKLAPRSGGFGGPSRR